MARNFTLNFPANAFGPCTTTTGPTYVNHGIGFGAAGRVGLAFSDSVDETAATGMFVFPSEYTGSGTLKAAIAYYTAETSGTLAMQAALEALGDGDAGTNMTSAHTIDLGGTPETVTVPGTAGMPDILTYTLTEKDSVAAGDIVRLIIMRDVDPSDSVGGDIYVAGVSLYEET